MNKQKLIKEMLKAQLANALKETGRSAKEISKLTDISYPSILDYMHGKSFPYILNFDRLVKVLGLDEFKIMNIDFVNNILDE